MPDLHSQAQAAHEAGDLTRAFALFEQASRAGDAASTIWLALLHQLGEGVAADGAKALDLLLVVADDASVDAALRALAFNNASSLMATGAPGLVADMGESARLLASAHALGFPR